MLYAFSYALSIRFLSKVCGVCADHRVSLAGVLLTTPFSTTFIVSLTGTPTTAAFFCLATSIVSFIIAWLTNGLAPSCIKTILLFESSCFNPL